MNAVQRGYKKWTGITWESLEREVQREADGEISESQMHDWAWHKLRQVVITDPEVWECEIASDEDIATEVLEIVRLSILSNSPDWSLGSAIRARVNAGIDSRLEAREQGFTQREIADSLGVSQPTVVNDLSEKSVRTEKTDNPQRKVTRYEISHYTQPVVAARRIIEVFGAEFAAALADEIALLKGESQ